MFTPSIRRRDSESFDDSSRAAFSGRAVTADIIYPLRRDRCYRCIIFVDDLARFAAGTFTKVLGRYHMLDALLSTWAQWLGMPHRVLVNDGTSFKGKLRGALSSMYGIAIVTAPSEAHFQVGKAERAIQIIKKSPDAITDHMGTSFDRHQFLALALMAHNLTPSSGTYIAPLTSLKGRINTLGDLQWIHSISMINRKKRPITHFGTTWSYSICTVYYSSVWRRTFYSFAP